jgi:hypothetical protein
MFPERSRLASLRERILSSAPELDLDLEIHKLFSRQASGEFLYLVKTLVYHVEGQDDYKAERSEWFWSLETQSAGLMKRA